MCNPEAMQAVAAGLSGGVTVSQVPNGPNLAGGTNYVAASGKVPAYCQVTGSYVTNPETGKTANFIATFPENWNGKYLQLGCSGSCGVLLMNNPSMPPITITTQGYPGQLLEKGYATFGNDLGHIATGQGISWDWAFNTDGSVSEDHLADWLYRADEVLADTGKDFARAFYARVSGQSRDIAKSYYNGCSQGGRGALIAAARFPDKFDGIIAGSPASDLPGLIFNPAGRTAFERESGVAPLSKGQAGLLQTIVTNQCDGLDGVTDGLIQNPVACNFKPERDLPMCKGTARDDCFTKDQARMVSTFVSATTDTSGKIIAPGHSVSNIAFSFDRMVAEGQAPDRVIRRFAGTPDTTPALVGSRSGGPGAVDNFRATGDAAAFRKVDAILRKGTVRAEDLSRMVQSGGKLLWYHNLSDEALSPIMSITRYRQLAQMHGDYDRLQRNVRLFLLPGTGHCGMSGVGPTNFDAIGALESWVEQGKAPDTIFARKLDPKAENLIAGKVDWSIPSPRTMPLCMFPQMAHYKGSGDVNQAANWECRKDDRRMLTVGESGIQAGVSR